MTRVDTSKHVPRCNDHVITTHCVIPRPAPMRLTKKVVLAFLLGGLAGIGIWILVLIAASPLPMPSSPPPPPPFIARGCTYNSTPNCKGFTSCVLTPEIKTKYNFTTQISNANGLQKRCDAMNAISRDNKSEEQIKATLVSNGCGRFYLGHVPELRNNRTWCTLFSGQSGFMLPTMGCLLQHESLKWSCVPGVSYEYAVMML